MFINDEAVAGIAAKPTANGAFMRRHRERLSAIEQVPAVGNRRAAAMSIGQCPRAAMEREISRAEETVCRTRAIRLTLMKWRIWSANTMRAPFRKCVLRSPARHDLRAADGADERVIQFSALLILTVL